MIVHRVVRGIALCALALLVAPLPQARAEVVLLHGAGSAFAAPFFTYTVAVYAKTRPIQVQYTPGGDGPGIDAFVANRVDFAASDTPLTPAELARANRDNSRVLQLPILLGAVAIAYDVPDLAAGTRLQVDGPTLAAIFLGGIRRWNDPAIASLNPGVALPALPILPIHVAESSGATYTFSDYLSSASPSWARRIGRGTRPAWPAGLAVTQGAVAEAIRDHPGAIGYADVYDVVNAGLPLMAVRNAAGEASAPTRSAVLAAAGQFPDLSAQRFSIVDAPGPRSYPIAGYTWILLRARHADTARGAALIRLFRWMSTAAQSYATFLNYVPLPPAAQQLSARTLDRVTVGK